MKKNYKSIISVCLILVMVMVSSSVSFAQTNVSKITNVNIINSIQDMGGLISNLSVNGNERTFDVAYANGVNSTINEKIAVNGDIEYNITEGDIANEVLLKADGIIYLDGEIVTLNTTSEATNMASNLMQPRVVGQYYNATSPPAGTPSSYTQYVTTTSTTLNLGATVIIGLTYGAFCIILGVLSTLAGIAVSILTLIFTAGQQLTPYSNHMSFRTAKYYSTQSNNGYFGTSFYIVKNVISHYGNSNYTGYLGATTSYGVTVL